MAKSGYLTYIHNLRGLAILYIVLFHCGDHEIGWGTHVFSQKVFFSLFESGTIIFVFISGFLFRHISKKNFNYGDYLSKKLRYVILPYLVWSLIPIADKLFIQETHPLFPEAFREPSVGMFFYMIFTGKHFGPFWFIPMIAIYYLLAPVILFLHKHYSTYLFPVVFILGLFIFDYGYHSDVLSSFIYFLPIYLFGMWANDRKDFLTGLGWRLIIPLFIGYVVITVLELMHIVEYKVYTLQEIFSEGIIAFNFRKLKVSLLCLIYLNIFKMLENRKLPLFRYLGDFSFGIYFVHLYFIILVSKLVKSVLHLPVHLDFLNLIVFTAIVIGFSLFTVLIIKRITGSASRLVIGS